MDCVYIHVCITTYMQARWFNMSITFGTRPPQTVLVLDYFSSSSIEQTFWVLTFLS